MKKEVTTAKGKFYRLVRAERNMFSVETVTIENDKVVSIEKTEETYLPIAFDKLRRATAEMFFEAVKENA
jgi:hypothetical protein